LMVLSHTLPGLFWNEDEIELGLNSNG